MTENEAIEVLKKNYPKTCKMVGGRLQGGFDDLDCEFGQAITMAIEALEEIQQYRSIGTVDECREVVEKQKPKTPDYEGDGYGPDGTFVFDEWLCPNCCSRYEIDYDDYD